MRSATVMIVDDDNDLRDSLCDLLEDGGYTAVCAAGGAAALDRLRREPRKPDMILLDLMMPGMNGWQFRERQLSDPDLASIPVVVMTATRELRGMQTDEVLFKPINLEKLLQVVGRLSGLGNVTAQSTARARVAQSEEHFRRMVTQQVQAGIAQADLDGRFEFANDRYLEIVGRSWADLCKLRGQDITHPDDLPLYLELFQELIDQGSPFIIEKRYLKPDGSVVWVQNSVSRIDDDEGRPKAVTRVTVDVTQRKHAVQALRDSEERYRHIFETAEVCLAEADLSALRRFVDGLKVEHGAELRAFLEGDPSLVRQALQVVRLRGMNPATLRMFGASSEDELLGSISTISPPDLHAVALAGLMALAEGKRLFSAEVALRTLAGQRLDVLLTTSFPTVAEGADRALVTLVDISARKLAEAEREARVAQMESAVRFSEIFIDILGHNLRNPLSAISTAASLLSRRAQESERIAKPVGRILLSADRMERMISQLLDFTRIRLGRGIALERTFVDMAEVSRLVSEEIELTSGRKIQLETAGDTRGNWDRDRLSHIATNLTLNACQHGTEGTPVRIRVDGSSAGSVSLEVRNQGVIPRNLLPIVFEPVRDTGDGPQVRAGSSSLGLGLYITQQIALAMGGTIRVLSDEAEGTRFIVELPRQIQTGSEETRCVAM